MKCCWAHVHTYYRLTKHWNNSKHRNFKILPITSYILNTKIVNIFFCIGVSDDRLARNKNLFQLNCGCQSWYTTKTWFVVNPKKTIPNLCTNQSNPVQWIGKQCCLLAIEKKTNVQSTPYSGRGLKWERFFGSKQNQSTMTTVWNSISTLRQMDYR